ncbi:MAG: ATP phosphoribosyltransferase regulatory subunit [Nitrospirae bacterium]|nr:ATP phosphoribosyltransferase regulatory subunit [Nitrospirota bacterium]
MTPLKDMNRPMLPKGMATFLPEAAVHKRQIEEAVLSVFLSWGYQEVIPPIFEYLDVIARGMGEDLIEKGYKFVDRGNGRLMLLRPDITPQIARMAAMLMADAPKPLRLCYRANVFRHEEEHAGRARELFQIGGELIGLEGPEADAEVISIAIQALQKVGLTDFKVAIGQVEFVRGLMNGMGLPADLQKQVREAVVRKDRSRLTQVLTQGNLPESKVRQVTAILSLFGREEVIEQAWELTTSPVCRSALTRLREIFRILISAGWKDHLLLDLAEIRGFDYYTGLVFEVFAKDLGVPLGRGGRYDSLIGKFGAPCPSTGFAFDAEQLQWAWQKSVKAVPRVAVDVLIVEMHRDTTRLFALARMVREKGYRVLQHMEKMSINEAVSRAKAAGAKQLFVLSDGEKALWMDCRTGKQQRGRISVLVSRL